MYWSMWRANRSPLIQSSLIWEVSLIKYKTSWFVPNTTARQRPLWKIIKIVPVSIKSLVCFIIHKPLRIFTFIITIRLLLWQRLYYEIFKSFWEICPKKFNTTTESDVPHVFLKTLLHGVILIVSSSFKFNIFKITCLLELNKPFFITYKLLPDII